jgi:VIT1/CCC1 family predicted Fe2+/Mn2+ transporter
MAKRRDVSRYRAHRRRELDSAALYRILAEVETQPQLVEVYRRLATVEDTHAEFWGDKLRALGAPVSSPRLSWKGRLRCLLAKLFGPQMVLPMLADLEATEQHTYKDEPEARGTRLSADERLHARLLQAIAITSRAGMDGRTIARLEGRHHAIDGNALRAAVLSANDGVASNLSLVMGVAGADFSSHTILITGLAGLLAGACSMAMGEWISVKSSRELFRQQIALEAEEIRTAPDEEHEELVLIYQSKGLSAEEAGKLATEVMRDPANALDTLSREELGIDPEELGGSAWEAAGAAFVLFPIGAIIPVLPFVFLAGSQAVVVSLLISALALFLIGAAITLLTGRSLLYSGGRQLVLGLAAAALTYGIGRLIGVTLAG